MNTEIRYLFYLTPKQWKKINKSKENVKNYFYILKNQQLMITHCVIGNRKRKISIKIRASHIIAKHQSLCVELYVESVVRNRKLSFLCWPFENENKRKTIIFNHLHVNC